MAAVGDSPSATLAEDHHWIFCRGKKIVLRRALIYSALLASLCMLFGRIVSFNVYSKTLMSHVVGTEQNTVATSPLNDKTLVWDSSIYRPWLDVSIPRAKWPPAMLLLTTHGWNQPNQTEGMGIYRTVRDAELYNGVINHPWFHPTAWEDIKNGNMTIDDATRYYVFFDLPTCRETNYPVYGGGREKNLDTASNRSTALGPLIDFNSILQYEYLFKDRLFLESPNATAILFDCSGMGLPPNIRNGHNTNGLPVSFASVSSLISRLDESRDQGLPPPMPKPVSLSSKDVKDIDTCRAEERRSFHAVYIGNTRVGQNQEFNKKYGGARGAYFRFHDNNRTFFLPNQYYSSDFEQSALANYTYEDVLKRTSFGVAPRGDCKFSYRFSEVLSAGAIPVVHADDWVWPFRPELVNWNECAVILPERHAGEVAMAILNNMTLEEKCKRRRRCYDIYKRYIETPRAAISGLIEGLELVAKGIRAPMVGIRCTEGDPDCNMQR